MFGAGRSAIFILFILHCALYDVGDDNISPRSGTAGEVSMLGLAGSWDHFSNE